MNKTVFACFCASLLASTAFAGSESVRCGRSIVKHGDSIRMARQRCADEIVNERSWTKSQTVRLNGMLRTTEIRYTGIEVKTSRTSTRELIFTDGVLRDIRG